MKPNSKSGNFARTSERVRQSRIGRPSSGKSRSGKEKAKKPMCTSTKYCSQARKCERKLRVTTFLQLRLWDSEVCILVAKTLKIPAYLLPQKQAQTCLRASTSVAHPYLLQIMWRARPMCREASPNFRPLPKTMLGFAVSHLPHHSRQHRSSFSGPNFWSYLISGSEGL